MVLDDVTLLKAWRTPSRSALILVAEMKADGLLAMFIPAWTGAASLRTETTKQ